MTQYLACVAMAEGVNTGVYKAGIIDPNCDVAQICRDCAEHVIDMCEEYTGKAPLVLVEVHSGCGRPLFTYIPGFLKFILVEILKNSCRATAELVTSDRKLQEHPINIIVCADE